MLVSMLLVALAPLLIMAIQGYHCASMAVVELRTIHLRSVVEARKARIEDWLRERREDLVSLSSYACFGETCSRGDVTKTDPRLSEIRRLLDLAHRRSGAYESLVLYGADWKRLAASVATIHSDKDLVADGFRAALLSAVDAVVTPPHFHTGGMIGIHIGVPVFSNSSRVGYIVSAVDVSQSIYPVLEDRTGLEETTKVYVVAADGRYFSRPSEGICLLKERSPLPEQLLLGDSETAVIYRDCTGEEVLGVASALPEFGWVLVAEMHASEAFAWLVSLRRRALATGTVSLVLVLFLALRSSRRLTSPLIKLAAVAQAVSQGHYNRRVDPLPGLEPGEVAEAFNRMLDRLDATQRQLVQSASLAAIGQLSSSIVHEMRNPLSSVKMNLKALREKVSDDSTYSELAAIASNQVDRLEEMLNDLLQYGKPLELHSESLVVADLLEDVRIALSGLCESHSVELRCDDHTRGGHVQGDREQLRRAITNLADNAVRASTEGSLVTISGTVEERVGGSEAVLHVDDTGPGLPDAVRDRLFEPFFTARGDGTGLGLANVRKIVDLHGGTVTGGNRPGGGARFTVRLPLGGGS